MLVSELIHIAPQLTIACNRYYLMAATVDLQPLVVVGKFQRRVRGVCYVLVKVNTLLLLG